MTVSENDNCILNFSYRLVCSNSETVLPFKVYDMIRWNCHCACATNVAVSHGKERLKTKSLRRPRQTHIEAVDMICWGRLFQVRAAATCREGPITDGGQACTTDIQWQWGISRSKGLRALKSAVYSSSSARYDVRCCPTQTLVHKNSKLELDPLRCSQQLPEDRSDAIVENYLKGWGGWL